MGIPNRWLTRECIDAALGNPPRGIGIPVLKPMWVDRTLGRAHPAFPLVFYGPVLVAILVMAHRPGTLVQHAGGFVGGWLVFTLVEYLLHRFVFHHTFPDTLDGRVQAFLTHGYHHQYPRDPTRLVMPPLISFPLALGIFLVAHYVLGGGVFDAGYAGFVAGYIAYDSVHYVVHHTKRSTGVVGWMRRYHLLHHHDHLPARYGVSSPLWDVILGTFREPRTRSAGAGKSAP